MWHMRVLPRTTEARQDEEAASPLHGGRRWGRHGIPLSGVSDRGSPASTELGNEGLETRNHHAAAKCKPTCIREIQALVNTW